jgi:hypothetical protein
MIHITWERHGRPVHKSASLRAHKSTALAGVGFRDEVCFIKVSCEGRCSLATGKHFC